MLKSLFESLVTSIIKCLKIKDFVEVVKADKFGSKPVKKGTDFAFSPCKLN